MPTSERLRYRWHHRALLALVTVVLAIAALEITVRLVSPQTLPGRFSRIDERVGWAHVPGSKGWWVGADGTEFKVWVQINSRGLRDREIPYDSPAGTVRLV